MGSLRLVSTPATVLRFGSRSSRRVYFIVDGSLEGVQSQANVLVQGPQVGYGAELQLVDRKVHAVQWARLHVRERSNCLHQRRSWFCMGQVSGRARAENQGSVRCSFLQLQSRRTRRSLDADPWNA